MKYRTKITAVLCIGLFMLTSCDEVFELKETKAPASVTANMKEFLLMQGDTCRLSAEREGEWTNPSVYWTSLDEDIAIAHSDGRVCALEPGDARIVVMSVIDIDVRDTAIVHVFPTLEADVSALRYDMPAYVTLNIGKDKPSGHMHIVAYCDDEIRGVSTFMGPYFILRTWSDTEEGDVFTLRCYYSDHGRFYDLNETLSFSSNIFKGYPSSPIVLSVKE